MQQDVESMTIPLLTEFLVFFKATLSTKLALIQSLYAPSSQSPTNLLTKFSSKTIAYTPAQCPFQVKILDANIRAIHRFYLRVREYLEWRLCGVIVAGQVDLFQNSIQKLFMNIKPSTTNTHQYHQIHATNINSQTVGDLFLQITDLQEKFIYKLLDKIRKTHPNGVDAATIDQIVIFMRDKMDAEGGVRKYWRVKKQRSEIQNERHSSMFVGGNSYTKLRPWMHRKDIIILNKDISIDAHQNNHFNSVYRTGSPFSYASGSYLHTSPLGNRNHHYLSADQQKYHEQCPQNEGIQLLARYARKEKEKIINNAKKMMADVMQIQYDQYNTIAIERNQKQEIAFLDDLILKNQKNKIMIDKFIRKYHRKMKKTAQYEQTSRPQPKSSNKSMKSAKCQQSASIFAGDPTIKTKNRSMFKSKGSMSGPSKDLSIRVLGVRGGGKKVLHLQLPTINGASRRKTTIDK